MKFFSLFHRKLKIYGKAYKIIYKKMPGHSRIVLLLKVALPSFVALFLGIIVLLPSIDDEINKIKINFINKEIRIVFFIKPTFHFS